MRPVLHVGVAPTHSGFVAVPHTEHDEPAGVAQGLGVAPEEHDPPEHTGWPTPPQGTHAVPVELGTLAPVHAVTRHAPLEQVKVEPLAMSAVLQTRPQLPQFDVSVEVFTQPAPEAVQSVRPAPHEVTHAPPEHTRMPVQRVPHAPQLLLSLWRLTHTLEHEV